MDTTPDSTAELRPATWIETDNYLSGHWVIDGAVETEHGLMVPAHQNIVIYSTRFREDDVVDGDYPKDDVTTVVHDCDDVEDAVRLIKWVGCTFAATGTHWAADPDGSFISDYATGERVANTVHLYGWSDADKARIRKEVG
jgi:hypothetical protein